MTARQLLGVAMMAALVICLTWGAARSGHLKALLTGALWGSGLAVFIVTAMWLITGSEA